MGLSFGKLAFGQWARGLGRWIPPAALARAGQPAALFFHGVEHQTLDSRLQTNHHEVASFRAILRALKDFDVLPLTAIDQVLADPARHRRAVFLMSDDGYRNTLSVAADILDEFHMPWTLFVSTAHIGTGRPNPVFLARLFFLHAPAGAHALPHFPGRVTLGDTKTREKSALSGIEQLRFLPAEKAEESLAAMRAAFSPGVLEELVDRFASEKFLDWNGVRALRDRGVLIGAHADSHWPMHAAQNEDYLRRQARDAKARIEREVGPCRFFAYPFGNVRDVGPAAWKTVREAGFTHAFTTLSGSLSAGGNPFLLPRYGLGPHDSHIGSLVPLLAAGNPRLRSWQALQA
jgi:peptidoglycan/xylan/chitin deacetylase (PgdA/CDA1 family)